MRKEQTFLRLLLTTTLSQQKALLATITKEQTAALVEIAYNLPRLTDLGTHIHFVSYLGDQKHSLRYKTYLIRKYSTRLLKALDPWKSQLLDMLE